MREISGVKLRKILLCFCVKDRNVNLVNFLYHLLTHARSLLFQQASERSHVRHQHLVIHSEILNPFPVFNLKKSVNGKQALYLKECGKFEEILIVVVGYLPEVFLVYSLLHGHVIVEVSALEVHLQVVGFVQHCEEGVEGVRPQDGPVVLAGRLEEQVVCPRDIPLRFMSNQEAKNLPSI